MLKTIETQDPLEPEVNKELCEAVGCQEEATEEITVNAGEFGVLILSVCKNCIGKFTE